MQAARTVFVVRPARFGFNAETAASNSFQQAGTHLGPEQVQRQAQAEFEAAVATLRAHGVEVLVFDDTAEPAKPDAVFPNNWLTLHPDGRAVLYPMCTPNRRTERRPDILAGLNRQFEVREVIDLSAHENLGQYLEGTGSIVFDHRNRVAYACLSPRTDAALLGHVAAMLGYRTVAFHAHDAQGQAIYHTNVMMCVGPQFAVVCLESITDPAERAAVAEVLRSTGHELVEISQAQVAQFAGNMLALESDSGKALLVLSGQAEAALTQAQRELLQRYCQLVPLAIPTIETIGGGSARCMLAEVYLPRR
ncbi:citrulline utilization hydrolase CtlX [Hymenobacter latericus]|uniref:citrulline utilization hydrolase CtlX n=1 Tax=Hymenobacter sp. YIM 151858-1 TaxID=2987688 RepID=UPI002225CA66|nr:arginine deiminase-related protein [Hymenobacter sp. YIM 151858-1]UYZ60741.1 arginine deiminase-related protein [Hymenobacter sp. YIM 151858-1]